ncbi:MAG: hypothetical protein ACK456_00875 [Pseudanabaenaceae cyanobacterium]|jgi:hypothetical protein
MADRESKSGNFWGGFLFGSLIGGVVGALVANTLSRRALAEADDFAEDDEPSTDDHSNGRDATRRNLEQKIAQLNASIDAVSKELSIDEAQRRRRTHLRPRAEAETSPDPEGNQ